MGPDRQRRQNTVCHPHARAPIYFGLWKACKSIGPTLGYLEPQGKRNFLELLPIRQHRRSLPGAPEVAGQVPKQGAPSQIYKQRMRHRNPKSLPRPEQHAK